jgi:NTE family protein
VLIAQINPLERKEAPTSSRNIVNRVNEISFNSSLAAEVRAVEFVARLIDHGRLARGTGLGQYRRINAHRIVLGENEKTYSADTELSTDYDFFRMLHADGRRAARRFLDELTTSASAARLTFARRPRRSGRDMVAKAAACYAGRD